MNKNFIEIIKNNSRFEWINNIYSECFENGFLEEAQVFYHQKKTHFESAQMLEYLKTVNILIKTTNSTLHIYSLIIGR